MKNDYPNLFISDIFFDSLDKTRKELEGFSMLDNVDDKRKSFSRVKDLFEMGNIYTNIKKETILKYKENIDGQTKDIKHYILKLILKEDGYQNKRELECEKNIEDCILSNFCFFIDKNHEDCENLSQLEGKIIVGEDFLNSSFYLEQTFAGESTDENTIQVDKIRHPCTSLVIIDRYLFIDDDRRPNKIPQFISFLKNIIPSELSKPFEVDIIIENKQKNIINKYNQILKDFSNNISLHIYAVNKKNFFDYDESDRYLITNYSVINIGHPWDRKTFISCNFYPSCDTKEKIKSSYATWIKKIIEAHNLIKTVPKNGSFGNIKVVLKSDDEKLTSNIKHSIFESVKEDNL